MKKIIFISLFLITINSFATDYYVRNGGNDSNSGLSDAQAWATLSKVNSTSFSPGDRIFFKCNSSWSGYLEINNSGTSSNYITYSSYGTGAKPVFTGRHEITGWDNTGNWSNLGGNRWVMSYAESNYGFLRIWLSGTEAKRCQTTSVNLDTQWYYDYSGGNLYVYATSNPASAFTNMEMSGDYTFISASGVDYIKLENLDIGGHWIEIELTNCDYWQITGCEIGKYSAYFGIIIRRSEHGIINNCTLDTYDRLMDMTWNPENSVDGIAFESGAKYWDIYDNQIIDWGHTGVSFTDNGLGYGMVDNKVHDNYLYFGDIDYGRAFEGEIQDVSLTSGNEIYNNLIEDQRTHCQIGFNNLKFYNNIFNRTHANPYNGYTGSAIMISGGGSSNPHPGTNMKFYNNIFAYCKGAGIWIHNYEDYQNINGNEFINNIFYECEGDISAPLENLDNSGFALFIEDRTNIYSNTYRNNLFYRTGDNTVISYDDGDDWVAYTVSGFNSLNGDDGNTIANNIAGDPLFVDEDNDDFHLTSSSPAKGVGYSPTLSSTDYDGVSWASPPAIGAYEYSGGYTPPEPPVPPSGEGKYVKHDGKYVIINGKYVKW